MTKYFTVFCALCFLGCTTDYQAGQPDGTVDATDAATQQDATVLADVMVQDGQVTPDSAPDAAVSICGNGVVTGTEQCDGQDFGVLTCGTFGFVHGVLMCNESCAVDTSGCSNITVCGDGVAEGTEECDQDDFRGVWCGDIPGFVAGQLVCTASCVVSTTLCLVSVCGDEVTTAPYEQCDGPDLGGLDCQGLGFDGGTLGCATDCTPDTTGCTMDPFCGDGIVDPDEECDEGGNQGQGVVDDVVCEDFGLQSKPDTGSMILCWQCQYVTEDCTDCGNNVKEWGERCDGPAGIGLCVGTGTPVCAADCRSVDCSTCESGMCM
jgi:hypothetical protein